MAFLFLTARQSSIFWNVNSLWSILYGQFMTYCIVWGIRVFAALDPAIIKSVCRAKYVERNY